MSAPSPEDPVVVVGGGPAGMAAASALSQLGHRVELIDRSPRLGGRLNRLDTLSPDRRRSSEELSKMICEVKREDISLRLSREVASVAQADERFVVELDDGTTFDAAAIVLATGLEEVPPALVPEFGHGAKDGVVSSIELEDMLRKGDVKGRGGVAPSSVVFIQCVGSRTERRGVPYCSALCCGNSVKSALELKERHPAMDVTILYIDLRTTGRGQEALYRQARKQGVRFVRGQPSLVMEKGGKLVVCGENTLLRELYELPADLVVLATGLRQGPGELLFRDMLDIRQGTFGFPSADGTGANGVYLCGSAKGPMDLPSAVADAKACALDAHLFIEKKRKG